MISDQEMEHLKTLARLELDQTETERLKSDLNAILGYFDQLQALDTDEVEELVRPVSSENVFRSDQAQEGLSREQALALAPESEDGFFKVPRTLE